MRMTHDAEANAAYIYLVDEVRPGDVARSRVAHIDLHEGAITVDFDKDMRILGIELLGATNLLREATIQASENITRHT